MVLGDILGRLLPEKYKITYKEVLYEEIVFSYEGA